MFCSVCGTAAAGRQVLVLALSGFSIRVVLPMAGRRRLGPNANRRSPIIGRRPNATNHYNRYLRRVTAGLSTTLCAAPTSFNFQTLQRHHREKARHAYQKRRFKAPYFQFPILKNFFSWQQTILISMNEKSSL